MTSNDHAFAVCMQALRDRPSGLFSDFDGTLSHVAPTPSEARLAEGAAAALETLLQKRLSVAIVTGRAANDAKRLIDLESVITVGNHGFETWFGGRLITNPDAEAASRAIASSMAQIHQVLSDEDALAGLVFEDKVLSGSIHYRMASDINWARARIFGLASALALKHDLNVTEGKFVVELRPNVAVNKGTAVMELARDLGLRGCVMLGDDITDVDAFHAMRQLRDQGVAAVSVGVVSSETPAAVIEATDVQLQGVDACIELLTRLAEALPEA